ncbi:hypothetical protein CSUI_007886 [Cystoisospora suis]|uniref:Uncharacterized protein n=1 Tax=Cystoisospora suis TaxID=483139 RepID=A0A2C6KPG5_9APIC|nr:hypothetical protein CSUI_007886 [Cystoisospora suis]
MNAPCAFPSIPRRICFRLQEESANHDDLRTVLRMLRQNKQGLIRLTSDEKLNTSIVREIFSRLPSNGWGMVQQSYKRNEVCLPGGLENVEAGTRHAQDRLLKRSLLR